MNTVKKAVLVGAIFIGAPLAQAQTALSTGSTLQGLPALKVGGPAGAIESSFPDQQYAPLMSYNGTSSTNPAINPTIISPPVAPPPAPPQEDAGAIRLLHEKTDTEALAKQSLHTNEMAPPSASLSLIGRAKALSSFEIVVDGQLAALSGVHAPGPNAICSTPQGETWSCGSEARQYLQTLLNQGVINCLIITPGSPPMVSCSVGKDDVATGMNQWPALSGFQRLVVANPTD